MIANIPWNIAWACSGIVAEYVGLGSIPTLCSPNQCEATQPRLPGPNAIEYPTSIH